MKPVDNVRDMLFFLLQCHAKLKTCDFDYQKRSPLFYCFQNNIDVFFHFTNNGDLNIVY